MGNKESIRIKVCCLYVKKNKFEVLFSREKYPIQRFFDVGALVYYLKAIPWQVPDLSVEKYQGKLYLIHQKIQSEGFLDVKQHRFIIKAMAIQDIKVLLYRRYRLNF